MSPPAPGVVPCALASMVPLIMASPHTDRMTGERPVKVSVLLLPIVRFRKTRTSTEGPPMFAAPDFGTKMTGWAPLHAPVVKACSVES
jgi:hypothetical protein